MSSRPDHLSCSLQRADAVLSLYRPTAFLLEEEDKVASFLQRHSQSLALAASTPLACWHHSLLLRECQEKISFYRDWALNIARNAARKVQTPMVEVDCCGIYVCVCVGAVWARSTPL